MDPRKKLLTRNKTIAVALMAGAALLFIFARLHKGNGWEWLAAFSEAAMVGALADWFAVVALFRHPLGIPIPHTAIVPGKKNAIAENLAQFIHDKFLATDALVVKLRAFDPARHLTAYLLKEENAQWLAKGVTRVICESLDFLEDERVSGVLKAALSDRVQKFDLAGSAGALIDTLRRGDRHQAVLDDLLQRLAQWLATEEAQVKLADFIDNWLNAEYPMLSMFLPNRDQFARGAGEKITAKVNAFIQEVNADARHELRQSFDSKVAEFGSRLKNDAALRAKIEFLKSEALDNAQLSAYVAALLGDLKNWLSEDLGTPQSRVQKKLSEMALGLGGALSRNQQLKDSINEHLESMVRNYADTFKEGITRHISGTVKEWEDRDFVEEIELSIGSDLQFIRMNGTLVGGLIGLLLHAVTLLLR
jgi:uncharacterized membrane-anchored protein YjiN (DUF445 family)